MADQNHGSPLGHLLKSLKYLELRLHVHGARGFVQDHDLSIPEEPAGHSQFLCLAYAKFLAVFEHLSKWSVIALLKSPDRLVDVRIFGGLYDPIVVWRTFDISEPDVLTHRFIILFIVLKNHTDMAAQYSGFKISQVGSIDRDPAGNGVIKSAQ